MRNVDLSGKNKYYTLYSAIRDDILSGKIKAGERLPSKRALAEELGVSVVTVQLAYEQLYAEGYIRSEERSGYFAERVQTLLPPAPRPAEIRADEKKRIYAVDFVKGSIPAELFPFSVWAKLMRGVLSDCGEHLLERVPCAGDKGLKRAISAYLYRARGVWVDPRYVIIGAGSEHLYGVLVQLLGRDKLFAVENPVYGKIPFAYGLNGARCTPVSVNKSGISLGELKNSGAAAVHLSPSHQFPTGAVTPASARSEIINWATESGAYIIEDEYDSEFRLSGKPLQSMLGLCPERVVYINTFSKSLAPSLRLGYAVLPPELFERYEKIFGGTANMVPLFEQKTLEAMLDGGHFERHINRLRNYYKTIRARLTEKLKGAGAEIFDTGGGLHLIAKQTLSDDEIKARAEAAGIRVKTLSDYLVSPLKHAHGWAVLNYSGVTESQIEAFDPQILFPQP